MKLNDTRFPIDLRVVEGQPINTKDNRVVLEVSDLQDQMLTVFVSDRGLECGFMSDGTS